MTSAIKSAGSFVPLTSSRPVDVVSIIAISAGRFDMDNFRRMYSVQYDPELRADRLWQAHTEEDQERLISLGYNDAARERVPLISNNVVNIAGFVVEERKIEDALFLHLDMDASDYLFMQNMIDAKIGRFLKVKAGELMARIIGAMPQ